MKRFTLRPMPHQQHRPSRQVFEGSAPRPRSGKESVRVIPLGGSGNVTKNMYVYEFRYDGQIQDILIVDCGIGFPSAEMFGVDLIIPDVRYLLDKRDKIRGLVFTHGHDDHIGGIPYIYPKLGNVPMWAPTLAAAFANIKLKETEIRERVHPAAFDKELQFGPFKVSFVRVTHSVPDTSHLIIETPVGIFYHGSDFKFDPTPLDGKVSEIAKINAVGKRGVLCLFSDSLGSERPGFTPSEQIIGDTIEKELKMGHGKILFTTQSSNISRIQLAIELALKHGRKIAFLGRSIDKNVEEAVRLGYMRFPRESVILDRELRKTPDNRQFLIVAGAQGQQESALARIANDVHKFVRITDQDTVIISADPIPGRENDVNQLIDDVYRHGSRVSYSDIMEDLHVSGHGSSGDMMLLLTAVAPRYVMPIGGTYKHLMQYRRLAMDVGFEKKDGLIPEDGEVLEFYEDRPPRVVDHLNLENVMIDGLGIGDVGTVVLRDRQTIAHEGIVVVVVPIEAATGRMVSKPEIITRGFIYVRESGKLLREATTIIGSALQFKKGRIEDWQFIRKRIEDALAGFLLKETGRSPLIVPVVLEV
jgi:ribonuclease J